MSCHVLVTVRLSWFYLLCLFWVFWIFLLASVFLLLQNYVLYHRFLPSIRSHTKAVTAHTPTIALLIVPDSCDGTQFPSCIPIQPPGVSEPFQVPWQWMWSSCPEGHHLGCKPHSALWHLIHQERQIFQPVFGFCAKCHFICLIDIVTSAWSCHLSFVTLLSLNNVFNLF